MRNVLIASVGAALLSLTMLSGAQAQPAASAADMVRSLAQGSEPLVEKAHWRRCHWVKRCNWRRCYWVRHCHRGW
jgi:hypothetical protein